MMSRGFREIGSEAVIFNLSTIESLGLKYVLTTHHLNIPLLLLLSGSDSVIPSEAFRLGPEKRWFTKLSYIQLSK